MKKTSRIVFSFLFLFFFSFGVKLQAQQLKVSGTVKDTTGLGLPGIEIKLKGLATTATVTDEKGHYSLTVPNGKAVLIFSGLHMLAEEKVGNRTNIDVKLIPGSSNLDEVVVIGYGSQKKRDVTGAISSVGAKQIEERQAVDVYDALQGQTPGVQISQESGRPGAQSSIHIRGISTLFAGANPLFVIDGAEGTNMDGINPGDIESIEILRDAASAAIYGSRSANGVVIITTKRGRDGKPRINVRQTTSIGWLSHKLPQANNDDRHLFEDKLAHIRSSTPNADSLNPNINTLDNDYQALLTRVAAKNQTDLSISGGSPNLTYLGSFSLLDENGIVINSWSNIARGRFNIDYKASNKITFTTRIQASYRTENVINDGNVFLPALERISWLPTYNPDGTFTTPIGGSSNPIADAVERKQNNDIYTGGIFNSINYIINSSLKFTVTSNLTLTNENSLDFQPYVLSSNHTDALTDTISTTTYWQVQGYFNYSKIFAQKHTVNGVLGTSADHTYYNASYESGGGLTGDESIPTINAATYIYPSIPQPYRTVRNSYYARLGDSYLGKYMINSSVRVDGSSVFAPAHRWGVFEAISLGWRFSEENFMDWSRKFLDDGKFRVSYGLTGNDLVPPYGYSNTYNVGSDFYSSLDGVTLSGISPNTQLGNPNLSWEVVKQLDLGLDLALLRGRLNFSVDFYNKVTDKLLYQAPLDETTGLKNIEVNIGSIRNSGIEFNINGYPYRTPKFTWNIAWNMSVNYNKVLSLYQHTPILAQSSGVNAWRLQEGGHIGDLYGYVAKGVYQYNQSNAYSSDWQLLTTSVNSQGDTSYSLNGKPYSGPRQAITTNGIQLGGGDAIWDNLGPNGHRDSIIDDRDRQVIGNAIPKWFGDLTNQFTYKQFSLSFNFYISWGNQLYNAEFFSMNQLSATNNTPTPDFIHKAWLNKGDVTMYPKIAVNSGTGNTTNISSLYVQDASFIRLRNARFTYQLKDLASSLKMNNVSIFMFGNNLALWTKYKGYDPEISFGSILTPGYDLGRYPRKRELGIGLNIIF